MLNRMYNKHMLTKIGDNKMTKEILFDVLKEKTRQISFSEIIEDQYKSIEKIKRQAAGNETKATKAYLEQEEQKLKELEGIVKRWIWEAFYDDPKIAEKTMYWSSVLKNFDIKVFVEKKEQ